MDDFFKPYSQKIRGDLEKYLREYDGTRASNMFYGPKYFFIIKEKGWIIPNLTGIRIGQHPVPDVYYVINSDFMLEGNGRGKENMSCVGAEKGIYDPAKALKRKIWSIGFLNLE